MSRARAVSVKMDYLSAILYLYNEHFVIDEYREPESEHLNGYYTINISLLIDHAGFGNVYITVAQSTPNGKKYLIDAKSRLMTSSRAARLADHLAHRLRMRFPKTDYRHLSLREWLLKLINQNNKISEPV